MQPPPQLQEPANKNGSGSDTAATNGAVSSEGFTSFFTTTNSSANNSGSPDSSDQDKKAIAKPLQAAPDQQDSPTDGLNSSDGPDDASSMVVLAPRVRGPPNADANAANQEESSISSASSEHATVDLQAQPRRIVTDISSSNRTDGTTSNTNSGSGSAGNTGSGSNQGSSGSGNDGKGSSEDLPKAADNNNDDGSNDISDGTSLEIKKLGLGLDTRVAHHHHHEDAAVKHSPGEVAMPQGEEVTREKKLLDKKRKRIEMRREYEAEYEALQQSESSENATTAGEQALRPGKPVTIDKVLLFSKIPRIVIQSTPPFLVVHTNAAFSRLTGIDAHVVVGKPISELIAIAESKTEAVQVDLPGAPAEATGRAGKRHVGLERLVATCGFGRLHAVQVRAKPHSMLGKNVTIIEEGSPSKQINAASATNVRNEGSNDASIASSGIERQPRAIICRSSIAPVVTSCPDTQVGVVSDKEPSAHAKTKRRKLAGEEDAHKKKDAESHWKRQQERPVITHYVIQLHPLGSQNSKDDNIDSLSSHSTSVEARVLGLTKDELHGQRMVLQQAAVQEDYVEEDESMSEEGSTGVDSETNEATTHPGVVAVG
jgi:hypothetical protein